MGDPVRSVSGGYLMEDVTVEAEAFPVTTLPPQAELAASACDAPLIGEACDSPSGAAPSRAGGR